MLRFMWGGGLRARGGRVDGGDGREVRVVDHVAWGAIRLILCIGFRCESSESGALAALRRSGSGLNAWIVVAGVGQSH